MRNDISKTKIIEIKVFKMEINDKFNVRDFINEHWEDGYNIWSRASFDVLFSKAKKVNSDKCFRTIKGFVNRIK
jgi:hypothetical protein